MRNLDDVEHILKKEFLSEARELLEECEHCYLTLDKAPNDAPTIDRIFRAVHTIKGSGASVGFTGLSAFAHKVEALLNLLRGQNAKEVTPDVIDTLLVCNDAINKFVTLIHQDFNATYDTSPAEKSITAILTKWNAVPAPVKLDQRAPNYTSPLSTVSPKAASSSPKSATSVAQATSPKVTLREPLKLRTFNILVCDDERDIIDTITGGLELGPFEFFTAVNGEDALKIIMKENIDLLITDTHMPRLSGPGLITKAKKHSPNLPFIVISGASEREDLIVYLQMGAYSFLEKPFKLESLQHLVRNVLRESIFRHSVIDLYRQMFKAHLTMLKATEHLDPQSSPELKENVHKAQELLEQASNMAAHAIEQGKFKGFGS